MWGAGGILPHTEALSVPCRVKMASGLHKGDMGIKGDRVSVGGREGPAGQLLRTELRLPPWEGPGHQQQPAPPAFSLELRQLTPAPAPPAGQMASLARIHQGAV